MKRITNLTDTDLPLPNGEVLRARSAVIVADRVAGNDRVQGWGSNVLIEEAPAAPEVEGPTQKEFVANSRRRKREAQVEKEDPTAASKGKRERAE